VLVSMVAVYTVIAFVASRYQKPWAQRTLPSALVALLFALLAMALLVFAPTTQIRAERYGEPASLPELVTLLFNFTREFVTRSVKDIQQLLIVLLAGLSGFVLNDKDDRQINVLKTAGLGLGIVALAVVLIAASLTPSAYVERGLPILRTQIIPRYIMVFAFVALGWIAGYALRTLYSPGWLQRVTGAALLLTLAFPLYTVYTASGYIPIYRERARLWDQRGTAIRSAIAEGASRVEVFAIDGAPVGGIRDFDPPGKKGYWISVCAMDYYGIKFQVTLP